MDTTDDPRKPPLDAGRLDLFKHDDEKLKQYYLLQREYVNLFEAAGLTVSRVVELPNRYCGDTCCPHRPAISARTQIGDVEFWWRKNVCVIDWHASDCTVKANVIFPVTADTLGDFFVHCWSIDSAQRRLEKVRLATEADPSMRRRHDTRLAESLDERLERDVAEIYARSVYEREKNGNSRDFARADVEARIIQAIPKPVKW